VIVGIRAKAKTALGDRFEIKDFHDLVLANGRVPLEVLQRLGDDWIARRGAA
jgi:uncharacterized protein (DUF885 family)